ncbi:hypothetical protein [Metabacillus fastidiosus]|uniref:hypothetical protein n=1 Tax=Metabacillus fastidiosus TaxID=1458 RepID=UPI002E242339|nr:hypothetical protein [Metabacillus fastidiosus]
MSDNKEKKGGFLKGCLGCFGLIVILGIIIGACTAGGNKKEEEGTKVPAYEITEERLDKSGMWYVTFSTASKNKEELKALILHTKELAKEQNKNIHSAFIYVLEKGSVSKQYTATGRIALTQKGLAQTGFEDTEDFEFEYKVEPGTENDPPKTAAERKHEGPTADEVLQSFQNVSLPTPEARDNTHNCGDLGCVKLITTEAVSIYEWPTVEKAQEVQGKNFGTHQAGPIIIRMNDKSLDPKAYIDTLNELIK